MNETEPRQQITTGDRRALERRIAELDQRPPCERDGHAFIEARQVVAIFCAKCGEERALTTTGAVS